MDEGYIDAAKTGAFIAALLAALYGGMIWWERGHTVELDPKPGMSPGLVDLLTKLHWARVDWCNQWADADKLAECIQHSEDTLRLDVEDK